MPLQLLKCAKKNPVLYSHKLFTPTFGYFYTAISETFSTLNIALYWFASLSRPKDKRKTYICYLYEHLHHREQGHGSDTGQKAEKLAKGGQGSFFLPKK